MFTKGNIHDTSIVEEIAGFFKGLLIGDKGYFSKTLFQNLSQKRSYANYRNSTEYEECFDGNLWKNVAKKTIDNRNCFGTFEGNFYGWTSSP